MPTFPKVICDLITKMTVYPEVVLKDIMDLFDFTYLADLSRFNWDRHNEPFSADSMSYHHLPTVMVELDGKFISEFKYPAGSIKMMAFSKNETEMKKLKSSIGLYRLVDKNIWVPKNLIETSDKKYYRFKAMEADYGYPDLWIICDMELQDFVGKINLISKKTKDEIHKILMNI